MISVETTPEAYLVRIPRGEVEAEDVERIVRWIRLEAFAAQNQMTEEEADALAEEIKADWWARNEHRFIPPEVRNGA
jgi:hypothetical protein